MKRIVLVFGLIAGAIMSAMMLVSVPMMQGSTDFEKGEVLGYATIVMAFMLIFFGIRSYRENVGGGAVSFGRAFKVGGLIALIASVCYVATWQVIYYTVAPDFVDRYAEHQLEKERASGASQEKLDAKRAQMEKFAKLYKNPFLNAAITFIEPLPIGLIVALVSAGILKRKRKDGASDYAETAVRARSSTSSA